MDITHGGAWCSLRPACGIRYEQVAAGGRLDSRNARPNQGRYAGDAQGSSLALCAGGLNKYRLGQNRKSSTRAHVFRCSSKDGHSRVLARLRWTAKCPCVLRDLAASYRLANLKTLELGVIQIQRLVIPRPTLRSTGRLCFGPSFKH